MEKINVKKAMILLPILLLIAEILLLTICRNFFGPYMSPVVILAISITIGLLIISSSFRTGSSPKRLHNKNSYLPHLFFFGGFLYAFIHSAKYYSRNPLNLSDASYSDILPQVGVLVDRFLHGEFPYQIINSWGYDLFPTYQPFQWMPFLFSEYFNIDYRWIPFIALTISIFYFQYKNTKARIGIPHRCFLAIMPWVILILHINSGKKAYSYTIESLIAAYYFTFSMAIFSKNILLKAFTTIICLLSRYTFILWLPFFGLVMYFRNNKRFLLFSFYVIAGILLFYVIPFLIKDPFILLKGYEYHNHAALAAWEYHNPSEHITLNNGLGFSVYFYDFINTDIAVRLAKLQVVHLILSLFSVLILSSIYFYKKDKCQSSNLYLLGSLKIYFAVFLSFIQLPYHYLFLTSMYLSLVCIYKVFERDYCV